MVYVTYRPHVILYEDSSVQDEDIFTRWYFIDLIESSVWIVPGTINLD